MPRLPPPRASRRPEGCPECWANKVDVAVMSTSTSPMMRRIKSRPIEGVDQADARGKATGVPSLASRRKAPSGLRFPGNRRAGWESPVDLKRGHMGEGIAQITHDDFAKVDVRVGRIVQVDDFPQARKPAYKLRIDFGAELGVKTSSAQITKHYQANELKDRLVLAVVNFPPHPIANYSSQVLTLSVSLRDGDLVLVQPDRDVPIGTRIA